MTHERGVYVPLRALFLVVIVVKRWCITQVLKVICISDNMRLYTKKMSLVILDSILQ